MTDILEAQRLTEKDLIEAVVSQFFFLDYGYISKVNANKTVNVVHAVKPMTTEGESLSEMETEDLEVLTISTGAISISCNVAPGDKVLLVGLKNPIKKVADADHAIEQTSRLHYTRECLKVIPLCVFNDEAKVSISEEEGSLKLKSDKTLQLNGSSKGGLVIGPELKSQLAILSARVDALYTALTTSATGSMDGGATYKSGISAILSAITQHEDFSQIENPKITHGDGE